MSPTHRKQGLYKRLYHHVRQEAENAGAAGLRLYAEHSNCTAHAAVSVGDVGRGALAGGVLLVGRLNGPHS